MTAGRSPAPALSPEERDVVARFEAAPVCEEAWRPDHREKAMEVMAWTPLTYDEFRAVVTAGQHPDDLESLELVDSIAAALAAAEQRGRDETARKVRELATALYAEPGGQRIADRLRALADRNDEAA